MKVINRGNLFPYKCECGRYKTRYEGVCTICKAEGKRNKKEESIKSIKEFIEELD